MEETKRFSAQNRVLDALYSLLGEKPYRKIKVTELTALAGINRGTFYKHFESVPDLLEKAQNRLCDTLCMLPVEKPKTVKGLENFARTLLMVFLREHEPEVRLLGGENGDVRTFWMIGSAMQTRLQQEADDLGARDEGVRRNILAAPGFFAVFLCQNVYQKRLRTIWPTLSPFTYRQEISFFENAARQFQQRRGGSLRFHYDLLLAYVKFYDRLNPLVSVTKLLEAAGISRTEFYVYYRNFEDFRQSYKDVIYASASLFCRDLCCAPAKQAAQMIAYFPEMNYGFVQRAVKGIVERGEIVLYMSILISSVYFLITQQYPLYPETAQTIRFQLLYEISSVVGFALMFYFGKIDYIALESSLQKLDDLRQRLGFGGDVHD